MTNPIQQTQARNIITPNIASGILLKRKVQLNLTRDENKTLWSTISGLLQINLTEMAESKTVDSLYVDILNLQELSEKIYGRMLRGKSGRFTIKAQHAISFLVSISQAELPSEGFARNFLGPLIAEIHQKLQI